MSMNKFFWFGVVTALSIVACAPQTTVRPNFDMALARHLDSISGRDLETFASTLTAGDELYMIFPDGNALTTPAQAVGVHTEWFADKNWVWDIEIIKKIVGEDMATVLLKYDYRDTPEGAPRSAWLVLVFKIENDDWRLVHDQNTRINLQEDESS